MSCRAQVRHKLVLDADGLRGWRLGLGQLRLVDDAGLRPGPRSLDRMGELADVERPVVAEESERGLRGQPRGILLGHARGSETRPHQDPEVLHPLAERRKLEDERFEASLEV